MFKAHDLLFYHIEQPFFVHAFWRIGDDGNILRFFGPESNENFENLLFGVGSGDFGWQFRYFPNRDFLDTAHWESYHTQLSLFVEFSRFGGRVFIGVSRLAIYHHVEQVYRLSCLLALSHLFFVEVYNHSKSPVILPVLHVHDSPYGSVRQNILWHLA